MKISTPLAVGGAAAAVAVPAALLLVTTLPAAAFDAGSFTSIVNSVDVSKTTGTNQDGIQVAVGEPCNAAATRHVLKVMSIVPANAADKAKADAWAGDNLYSPVGVGLPGPLEVFSNGSIQQVADQAGQSIVAGKWNLELRCQNNLGTTIYEQWHGSVTFTSPTAWKADPLTIPVPTTTTTTTTPTTTTSTTTAPTTSTTTTSSTSSTTSSTTSGTTSSTTSPTTTTSTTSSTSSPADGVLTATIDGEPVESGATVEGGTVIQLNADGFTAGESVEVLLAPAQEVVATLTAAPDGSLVYSYTVPSDVANGSYTLTLTGADSAVAHDFAFAVGAAKTTDAAATTPGSTNGPSGDSLAHTGAAVAATVTTGLALLAAGALAFFASRRGRWARGRGIGA